MEVKLTYFKESGKYYSGGSYEAENKPLFEIWDEVREMQAAGKLPGLVSGATEFIISVDVPEHEHAHPRLIIPHCSLPNRVCPICRCDLTLHNVARREEPNRLGDFPIRLDAMNRAWCKECTTKHDAVDWDEEAERKNKEVF